MPDPLVAYSLIGFVIGAAGGVRAYVREAWLTPGVVALTRMLTALFGALIVGLLAQAGLEGLFDVDKWTMHPIALIAAVIGGLLGPCLGWFWGFPGGVPDIEKLRRRGDVGRLGVELLYPTGPLAMREQIATSAAKALGTLQLPETAQWLVDAVLKSPWAPTRRAAFDELNRGRWPEVGDLLRRAAEESQHTVRALAALKGLGLEAGDAGEVQIAQTPAPPSFKHRRLPVGRAPGEQTSQVPAFDESDGFESGAFGWVAFALVLTPFIFLASRLTVDGAPEVFGGGLTDYAIGAGAFVVACALATGLNRLDRSGAAALEIVLDDTEIRRGDELGLSFSTRSKCKVVEIMLCCTEYRSGVLKTDGLSPLALLAQKSSEREGVLTSNVWESEKLVLRRGDESQRTTVNVPLSAPFSYEGQVLSLGWRVGVRTPRRWRASQIRWEPIWVLP